VTGTCPSCRLPIRLDAKRRIAEHGMASRYRGVGVPDAEDAGPGAPMSPLDVCDGSGQWSVERRTKSREQDGRRRKIRRRALLAPFRAHAAVALDAALERRKVLTREVAILLHVAMYDYRSRIAGEREGRSGATLIFTPVPRKLGAFGRWLRVDVYCRFCGELVMLNVAALSDPRRHLEAEPVRDHCTPCALKHLAFDLQPAPPGTRRLAEHLLEEQACE
jgi:hypothetical protein